MVVTVGVMALLQSSVVNWVERCQKETCHDISSSSLRISSFNTCKIENCTPKFMIQIIYEQKFFFSPAFCENRSDLHQFKFKPWRIFSEVSTCSWETRSRTDSLPRAKDQLGFAHPQVSKRNSMKSILFYRQQSRRRSSRRPTATPPSSSTSASPCCPGVRRVATRYSHSLW